MSPGSSNRVVLTGCGWVTPFAAGGIDDVLIAAGRAGHTPSGEQGHWSVPDDRVDGYAELSAELKRDRGAWIAGIAYIHACRDASLLPEAMRPEQVGLVIGCALAGQLGMINFANEVREQSPRFVSPIHFPQTVGNYIAGALARAFNIRGPNVTLASGAASGLDAVAEGCALLRSGAADVVVAGGVEELSEDLARGLGGGDVPFSEGACLVTLERSDSAAARGATPLATIDGCSRDAADAAPTASTNDALLACASGQRPGAIVIEHWVGRCLGVAGAAALAAVVGAGWGRDVPRVGATDRSRIIVGPIDLDALRTGDGLLKAVVLAEADDAHTTTVELTIPPRRQR